MCCAAWGERSVDAEKKKMRKWKMKKMRSIDPPLSQRTNAHHVGHAFVHLGDRRRARLAPASAHRDEWVAIDPVR